MNRPLLIILSLLLTVAQLQANAKPLTRKHKRAAHAFVHKPKKLKTTHAVAKSHLSVRHEKTVELNKMKEAVQLNAMVGRINRDTSSINQEDHIDVLASEFHVPLTVIDDERNRGESWGNITLKLATAQLLAEKNPRRYVSAVDALADLEFRQVRFKTWAQVANSAHIPVKQVLSLSEHSYQSAGTQGTVERASL